jgi:mono/diheme cytochrome c family protein
MDTRSPAAPAAFSLLLALLLPLALHAPAAAAADGSPPGERTGARLYAAACAACHGTDGRGTPQSLTLLEVEVPDLTDCSFATPEPDADWLAVSHLGGPERVFDRRMPAFGEALTSEELQGVVDHVRTFCASRAWPRGELNLPRALVTEKAFPENEAVLTVSAASGRVGNEFVYEKRFGPRAQIEVVVPIDFAGQTGGGWSRGLGDAAFAVKHALYHSHGRGSILSVAGEVVLATGRVEQGLGRGVTVFEPFLSFGQILPADSFLQAQAGLELPANRQLAENEAFWRVAIGKTLTEGRWGRAWSPMVELLAARELVSGEGTRWDLVPQMQVTLSRRQHVMMNAGVRLPLNRREGRDTRLMVYLLWDWFDGGLFEGWRREGTR